MRFNTPIRKAPQPTDRGAFFWSNEMSEKIERPDIVEDSHLIFLDVLQGTGATNMFGAGSYLEEHQELSRRDARTVLKYWMQSYGEREHPAAH